MDITYIWLGEMSSVYEILLKDHKHRVGGQY
jgi:hypothetical protein